MLDKRASQRPSNTKPSPDKRMAASAAELSVPAVARHNGTGGSNNSAHEPPTDSHVSPQGIPASTLRDWARRAANQQAGSPSAIIARQVLHEALKELGQLHRRITAEDLKHMLHTCVSDGEKKYRESATGNKARILHDNCEVWTLRFFIAVAGGGEHGELVAECIKDLSQRTATVKTHRDPIENTPLVNAVRQFEAGIRPLRDEIAQVLSPEQSQQLFSAIDRLVAYLKTSPSEIYLSLLEDVREKVSSNARGGPARKDGADKPLKKVAPALAAPLSEQLKKLELEVYRQFLPYASKLLRELDHKYPAYSYGHVAHIAECLKGALDNGGSLPSISTFQENLALMLARSPSQGVQREELRLVRGVYEALRVFKPQINRNALSFYERLD